MNKEEHVKLWKQMVRFYPKQSQIKTYPKKG